MSVQSQFAGTTSVTWTKPAQRQVIGQPEDPVHEEHLVRLAPEQERAARPLDDRHLVPGQEPVHGPGVERPAIVSLIPSRGGHTYMLDLGANASCTPAQLCQFAVMGSVLAADLEGAHQRPRVGLLNIGEEEIKGNDVVQAAHILLAAMDINYVGFVEGHDIFSDKVDVVVTDGFTGNIALKSMEGAARLIIEAMREEFVRSPLRKLGYLAARPTLNALRKRIDPRRYNGATMVGLNGIVIKSHGDTDLFGFQRAIEVAVLEARNGVTERIAQRLGVSREAEGI